MENSFIKKERKKRQSDVRYIINICMERVKAHVDLRIPECLFFPRSVIRYAEIKEKRKERGKRETKIKEMSLK